ncbi:MAG TPA: hypothetical protein VE420_16390, partial [Gemmatimonadales bacterium]|nr:hypothetical protein [Gemmatimonadales bacterium]
LARAGARAPPDPWAPRGLAAQVLTWDRPGAWDQLAQAVPVDQAVLVVRWSPARSAPQVGLAPLALVARVVPVGPADPVPQGARADLVPGAARAPGVKGNLDPMPARVRRGNDGATPR